LLYLCYTRFYTLISVFPDAASQQILGSKPVQWKLDSTTTTTTTTTTTIIIIIIIIIQSQLMFSLTEHGYLE
jgi:hypothetical protein